MPWKIEKRDGKHCVIKVDGGKVEKCHTDPAKAKAHMRALYSSENKEMKGFTVKQIDGVWHWVGVVSNNWIDKDYQWISSRAHKRYVEMMDKGEFGPMIRDSWLVDLPGNVGQLFKDIADRGTPDLWYWHLPIPIGYTDTVGFDERGYLVAFGKQRPGEFYSNVFQAISETEVLHGMSHGMPRNFIKTQSKNQRVIDEYLSTEFTALPGENAANFGTSFSVGTKEAVMLLPKEKAKRMTDVFGEETVARFDALLGELEVFAIDSEIPRKEKQAMSETTAKKEAEVTEAELEVDEVEEEAEGEESEAEGANADDAADSSTESGETEEGEEVAESGMDLDPTLFRVPTDFKEFAEQMKTALKEVVIDLQASNDAQIKALSDQLENQRAEIAQLREGEDERIAKKAAETPIASMAGWLATEVGSVIGKEDARLHGNKERELYNKTKQEVAPEVPGVPSSIARLITKQRGRGGSTLRVSDAMNGLES